MTIKNLLNCRAQVGDVGVEIELEADNIPHEDSLPVLWKKEEDPSLRGESAEFVMQYPVPIADLESHLQELKKCLVGNLTIPRPTYRAGIHVHVNVQDLTPVQLVTFICSYFMLEEVLLRFCDKSRLGNHFCLRMSDASYLLDKIVQFIESEDLHTLNTEDLRYGSLNITSLFKYGSVEFRALESTLDVGRINTWAGVLVHLRDYAKTLRSPVDLLGQASQLGFEQYAPVILGNWYPAFRAWATEENIKRGIRNIQYAIYSRDWSKQDLNIFKSKNLLFTP
jgi:hypothetical protein